MQGFKPISSLIASALPSSGDMPADSSIQTRLVRFWHAQLGMVAMHSFPLLFTSGRLVVFVESAAWGNEIRHQSHSLMETLAQHDISVRSVKIQTRLPGFVKKRKTNRNTKPQMSCQNATQLKLLAEKIDHPGLRQSLTNLAKHGMAESSDEEKSDNTTAR